MPDSITAADVMTPLPIVVDPDLGLEVALHSMTSHGVRHLPVVSHGEYLGMLSDRGIAETVGDPREYLVRSYTELCREHVRDAMTPSRATLPHDLPLAEVGRRFVAEKLDAMPVSDAFGALIGIVSYVDVIRAFVAKSVVVTRVA